MGKFLSTKLARDDSKDRERIACETVFFDRAIFRETRTGIRGLFIPFGAVWLSQFALPVSRSPARVYRTRCHEYSFSLSLLAGFPFRPTPTAGFRSSDSNRRVPTIDASTIRSTSSSFSNTWPLLSGFVGGEKGKNEIEKLFPLLRTIRRGYESRDFKHTIG